MNERLLSAGKLLHHFHLKSLWSYLCMRYTGRWAWNLILYLLLIVFISICLAKWSVLTRNLKHKWLSSCHWFQFKALTVFRIFMFNCMGSITLILKVCQRSMLELLLFAHRCTCAHKMLGSLVQSFVHFPFLSWSAVFVVFCPTAPSFFLLFSIIILNYIYLVSATKFQKQLTITQPLPAHRTA